METSIKTPAIQTNTDEPLTTAKSKKKKKAREKDLYNDTPLRKLGFLDEIGESLRPVLSVSKNPIVKNLPNFAYIPSTLYMAADVYDKYKKGLDGTGEKPSIKMGVREACYQGIVSVLAPVGIVKGVHKLTGKLLSGNPKLPKGIQETASNGVKMLKNNKYTGKIVSKAGMPGKIAGAALSIFAVMKLTKPVDWAVSKFFNKVVDPLIGANKEEE